MSPRHAGTRFSIYYDASTTEAFCLTFDGTKWTGPAGITAPGSASGTVKCLYDGDVKVASSVTYTYSGSTLSFNINSWTFLTEIQVVVSGITYDNTKTYTLACDHLKPCTGYTVNSDGIAAQKGSAGTAVTGIANTDGVAFVFATSDIYGSAADYKFTFNNAGSTLTYTASSKNLTSNASSIKGFKIASSKFSAALTGTAKAKLDGTNEVDVTWVQLWKGGPKWATINVGVTSTTATGDAAYGGLYRWGGSNNMRSNTSASDDHNTGTSTLSGTDDTATKLWGSNWRMPTQAELQDLINKCTWSSFSSGYTLTGKDGYSSNSIFLPAAGYFNYNNKTVNNAGSNGNYWSSAPNGSNNAYNLNFNSGNHNMNNNNRNYGFCVRAVLE